MQDIAKMVKDIGWRDSGKRARKESRDFYIMIGPWLIGFLFLSLFPLILGLATSFTNYNGLNLPDIRFMGFRNYTRAFESPDFWTSLRNTFLYTLVVVPLGQVVALGLAMMLNRQLKGRSVFRLLYYIPAILPLAGAVKAWSLMFSQNAGAVNAMLSVFVPGLAINWVNQFFVITLIMFSLWGVGAAMVIYLAGLQGVPEELREAAQIDGANRFQTFFHIILPLLTPVIFFQVVLGIIGSLQVLDAAILLWGRAGLTGATMLPGKYYLYMVYVYNQIFDFQRYGYGIALSWIFFIVVLILTLLLLASSRFWVYYEVAQEGEKS
jgi:multiple sugar transport system permease protein